ncbi:MAG: transposase [Dermatophilaceae bacterium]|nr:transposase [Dermatophilaceae bacterium]
MALDDSVLLEVIKMLRTADGGALLRRLLGSVGRAEIDAEATEHSGAAHQCTDDRPTHRNDTRGKLVTTAAGGLTVRIPKLRSGSLFPALLAPRRVIDAALHAVVMQAYVEGVSTRRVGDLVIAMGSNGIRRSEVPRICAQLDADVAIWRTCTMRHIAFPCVFLDATNGKLSRNGWAVSPSRRHRDRRQCRR